MLNKRLLAVRPSISSLFFFPSSAPVTVFPAASYHIRTMATTNGDLEPKDIEQEAQRLANGHSKVNAWSDPGRAAFDFRSKSSQLP